MGNIIVIGDLICVKATALKTWHPDQSCMHTTKQMQKNNIAERCVFKSLLFGLGCYQVMKTDALMIVKNYLFNLLDNSDIDEVI